MSGASSVRGGFDSHAFPPGFRALAFALLLSLALPAAPALAQATRPPAIPSPAAAPPRIEVVGDRAARADSARRRAWHEQPRFVMARSLLVPGWGQLHNGSWFKAGLVAGGEAWLATLIVRDQRELDRLLGQIDDARADTDQARELELVNQYNTRLDERLGHQWLFGALLAYALVDAYVDAHFRGFDLEFKTDPALPAGRSPDSSSGRPAGAGMRLALRWDF